MPKFRVYKGQDAWAVYSRIVQASSVEEANKIANDLRKQPDGWEFEGTREFDHSEVFGDETEKVA